MQDDNEQYELVRNFLRENWIAITTGIVIGVGGLFGWNYYQAHQTKKLLASADNFYTLTKELDKSQVELVSAQNAPITPDQTKVGQVVETLSASPALEAAEKANSQAIEELKSFIASETGNYSAIAALELANFYIKDAKFSDAEAALSGVTAKIKDEILVATVNASLARVQSEQGKYSEALSTLDLIKLESWKAANLELKGDILSKQGDKSAAKSAYEQAIAATTNINVQQSLRTKLNNLSS